MKINTIFVISIIFILAAIVDYKEVAAQEKHETGISIAGQQTPEAVNLGHSGMLKFGVTKESQITISLFDPDDNLVKFVTYDNLQPGIYECNLQNQLPSGKYKCNLNSGESSELFYIELK